MEVQQFKENAYDRDVTQTLYSGEAIKDIQFLEKRNYTVDLFRLIGALAVVLLHVDYQTLPNELVLFLRWSGRWAVPFFFIVSGYFFQKNYRKSGDQALLKSLQSLILIALVVNLVYLPFNIYQYRPQWSEVFTIRLFTMNHHLWFVNSLIIGYLLLWVLIKRKKEKWLLPIACFVILFSLLTNAYGPLLRLQTEHSFSMMVLSLPFLIFGYKAAENSFIERKLSIWSGLTMVIVGFFLQNIEILALYKFSGYSPHNQEFLLGTVLFSLGMFILALKIYIPQKSKLVEYGRDFSLPIYLYHPLIIDLVNILLEEVSPKYSSYLLWLNPLLCVLTTFVLVWLLANKFPRAFRLISGS